MHTARKVLHGRHREFKRLKKIRERTLADCMAEIRKAPRYREAPETKVKAVADSRLEKFGRELFSDFSRI